MSNSIFAAVQKDLGAQSRDLTALVKQVKVIMPQFSDDTVCEALVQSDEDIQRAVDLLLSAEFASKAAKKKKERKERQAAASEAAPTQAGVSGVAAGNEELQPEQSTMEPERESRPKTATEREAARLRKKLREIERIEERLARGEKVDPLQLPKLDKKHEVEMELIEADRRVQQEELQRLEEQRQEERRQQEERRAMELAAQEEAARKERERREEAMRLEREHRQMLENREREERDAREAAAAAAMWEADAARTARFKAQVPPTPAPQHHATMPVHTAPQREQETSQPQQAKGMELLSMLHTAPPGSEHGYQQSKQMADKLSGGRGHVLVGHSSGMQGAASGASGNGYPQNYRGSHYGTNRQRNEAMEHKLQSHEDPQRSRPERSYQDWYHQGQPHQRAGGFHQDQSEHAYFHQDHEKKEPTTTRWAEEKPDEGSGNTDQFATLYSTALDVSKISPEKQREAERIAKEIEGSTRRVPDDNRQGENDYSSRPRKGGGAKGCGKSKWDGGGRGSRHRQGHEPTQRWS